VFNLQWVCDGVQVVLLVLVQKSLYGITKSASNPFSPLEFVSKIDACSSVLFVVI